MMKRSGVGAGLILGLIHIPVLVLGCSSSGRVLESGLGAGTSTGGAAQDADAGSGGASGGKPSGGAGGVLGTGGVPLVDSGSTPPLSDGGVPCRTESHRSERIGQDLYIMMDQSSSMNDPMPGTSETWWSAAQTAMNTFVAAPANAGVGVGIQYFPLGGVAPASCAAAYDTPDVEIAALPGNGAALHQSLQSHSPTTFTPTGPALQGAINHMLAWAVSHPNRAHNVVLVTDGFPTECEPQQISDIAAIANAGLTAAPAVHTFVIGLNLGASGANLSEIARAGGTHRAVLVDGPNAAADIVTGLRTIATLGTELLSGCSFATTPGNAVDLSATSVRITDSGVSEDVARVANAADCASHQGNGWYFDDATHPTKVSLCETSCLNSTQGVDIGYGCLKP